MRQATGAFALRTVRVIASAFSRGCCREAYATFSSLMIWIAIERKRLLDNVVVLRKGWEAIPHSICGFYSSAYRGGNHQPRWRRVRREIEQGGCHDVYEASGSRSDDSHGKLSGVCWRGVTEENEDGARAGRDEGIYSGNGKVANGGKTGGTRRKTNTEVTGASANGCRGIQGERRERESIDARKNKESNRLSNTGHVLTHSDRFRARWIVVTLSENIITLCQREL